MPIPRLIHPVPVTIEQISTANTLYDDDAREPIQFAARTTPKTIAGQVSWQSQFNEGNTRGGTIESSAGYVLFRQIDLTAASIELHLEDRISRIGTCARMGTSSDTVERNSLSAAFTHST